VPERVLGLPEALARARDAFGDGHVLVEGRKVIEANAAYLAITGRSLAQLQALESLLDVLAPEERKRAAERWMQRGLSVPVDEHYETVIERPDGARVDVDLATVVVDPQRHLVLIMARDITARKRAEAMMRESQERMTILVQVAQEGIVVHEGGKILEVNPAIERLTGWRSEELRGRMILDFVAPHHRALAAATMKALSEEPYEADVVRKDGSVFPASIHARSIRLGAHDARVVTVRDVTEKRERLVAKKLVRRLLSDLGGTGSGSGPARRELGRALALETQPARLDEALATYASMGLGTLAARACDEDAGRFEIEGDNLLERTPGSGAPTCHIALGFLEAALGAIAQQPALGAEIACQSQGASACRFVVRARRLGAPTS